VRQPPSPRGKRCFIRALQLADEAGDAFGIANAARHAGLTLVRSGHPNDALKCFQLGQFSLREFQPCKSTPAPPRADSFRILTLAGRLNRNSATAYALMDHPEQAKRSLAEVHVRTGEPRRLVLTRQAIDAVSSLQSVAVRRERLMPLATAWRPGPATTPRNSPGWPIRSPRRGCNRRRVRGPHTGWVSAMARTRALASAHRRSVSS
jgi:hypothetical protein